LKQTNSFLHGINLEE